MGSSKLVLLIGLMSLCACAFAYDWSTNPGNGSPGNPYQISTTEQLMSIGSNAVLLTKQYILMNDIIFDPNNNSAHIFTAALIAPYVSSSSPAFSGFFDGNEHRIINLKIAATSANVGLFGQLLGTNPEQVMVQDLTVVNPIIGGSYRSGALVGRMEKCRVERCHVLGGSIEYYGGDVQGGLAGAGFYSTIADCSSSAQISGRSYVGGLIGSINSSAIVNSSASASVSGSGSNIGGLVGNVQSWNEPELIDREEIVNCSASGDVFAYVGKCCGLIGFVRTGLVKNCYAAGKVTAASEAGGLIGYIERERFDITPSWSGPTTVIGCCAWGNVNGQANYVGGLIGRDEAVAVKDCYARGDVVSSAGSYVGGLMGSSLRQMARCYSTGSVSGASSVGGLLGGNAGDAFLCYWDTESSQTLISAGGLGKTTSQMMAIDTYDGWGDDVWVINDANDYPHLAWEDTPGQPLVDNYPYSGGDGSPEHPYKISNADELVAVGRYMQNWDKHFELTADITLDPANLSDPDVLYANANFNKIGLNGLPFTGYFNGNFKTISNLRHLTTDRSYIGLFGSLEAAGPDDTIVENLQVVNPVFSGGSVNGGLAGSLSNGKVARCGVADFAISYPPSPPLGCVTGVGGLIGYIRNSTVWACFAEGSLSLGSRSICYNGQGGLIGTSYDSTVKNSYALASFATAGNQDGGFAGYTWNTAIQNCYAVPVLTGGFTSIPGLVGYANMAPVRCFYRAGSQIASGYGGTPLGDSSMKQRSSFFTWDFLGESANGQNEIWRMCADGVDYPRLSWEFAQDGDFACAGGVDLADLLALAEHWLMTETNNPTTFSYAADANGDSKISLEDLDVLSSYWP